MSPRPSQLPRSLRGTGRAGFHPGLDQRAGLLLCTGRRAASGARRPGPAHKRIFADVVDEAAISADVAAVLPAIGAMYDGSDWAWVPVLPETNIEAAIRQG